MSPLAVREVSLEIQLTLLRNGKLEVKNRGRGWGSSIRQGGCIRDKTVIEFFWCREIVLFLYFLAPTRGPAACCPFNCTSV